MNSPDNQGQNTAQPRPKLTGVLSVSVALHLLIGYLLFREYHQEKQTVSQAPAPIQAKLVFVELAPLAPAQPAPEPAVSEIIESSTEDLAVQDEPPPPATEPATQSQPTELPAVQKAQTLQREDLPPILSKSSSSDENPINLRGLAKQHLQSIEAQKQQAFVAGQAGAYRQQRLSPELRVEPEDPFVSEDEKLLESTRVNVDCSSTAAKTVTLLSMFTGGAMRCTPSQSITPYIQNRLNKGIEPDEIAPLSSGSQSK